MTWNTNFFDPQFRSMHLLAAALVLLGSVSAQDTFHCPDGWFWHEGHGGRGHCYFFSMEQLSKMNGEILCASHGGWIVEIPHPGSITGSRRCFSTSTPLTNKRRPVFPGATSSGWEQSLRSATMTMLMETGGGLMPMPASSGLTGETTSPMTSAARTA